MSAGDQGEINKRAAPAALVAPASESKEHTMKKKPQKTVTVEVNEVPVATPKEMTPRAALVAAGRDPAGRQLMRVKGKRQESFSGPWMAAGAAWPPRVGVAGRDARPSILLKSSRNRNSRSAEKVNNPQDAPPLRRVEPKM
ncbi:MAG: hypothetical protein QM572_00675 [Nocardioides sp.]|uniref:hypothetical protein n=1 Tax=Nocardioides sp. TaxID=35761 RepID=UPI0039E52BBE